MIRTSILSSLVLSLVLVAGCKKDPEGTTPPGDDQTADSGDKKPGKKPKADKGGDTGGDTGEAGGEEGDITQTVCPAETAEFPEVYFEETVLIRLPKNVTADNFVEMQPGVARISGEVESVSCVEGLPGAVINFMVLGSYAEDKGKTMTVWRDEALQGMQYANVTFSDEKVDEANRFYRATMDVPAGENSPEGRSLIQLAAANGNMYVLVMETHPNAWNAMKETFKASADSLKFLKPQ